MSRCGCCRTSLSINSPNLYLFQTSQPRTGLYCPHREILHFHYQSWGISIPSFPIPRSHRARGFYVSCHQRYPSTLLHSSFSTPPCHALLPIMHRNSCTDKLHHQADTFHYTLLYTETTHYIPYICKNIKSLATKAQSHKGIKNNVFLGVFVSLWHVFVLCKNNTIKE